MARLTKILTKCHISNSIRMDPFLIEPATLLAARQNSLGRAFSSAEDIFGDLVEEGTTLSIPSLAPLQVSQEHGKNPYLFYLVDKISEGVSWAHQDWQFCTRLRGRVKDGKIIEKVSGFTFEESVPTLFQEVPKMASDPLSRGGTIYSLIPDITPPIPVTAYAAASSPVPIEIPTSPLDFSGLESASVVSSSSKILVDFNDSQLKGQNPPKKTSYPYFSTPGLILRSQFKVASSLLGGLDLPFTTKESISEFPLEEGLIDVSSSSSALLGHPTGEFTKSLSGMSFGSDIDSIGKGGLDIDRNILEDLSEGGDSKESLREAVDRSSSESSTKSYEGFGFESSKIEIPSSKDSLGELSEGERGDKPLLDTDLIDVKKMKKSKNAKESVSF